jgi:hypothetical protein
VRWVDLLWLLGYPVYQVIGTLRHESAHALAAIALGGRITDFVILPGGGFFGYVRYAGAESPFITAAPYLADLLTFLLAFPICMAFPFRRRWLWINVVILGVISPLVNSAFNYSRWSGCYDDVEKLLDVMPDVLIHGYFLATVSLYVLGGAALFTRARIHGRPQGIWCAATWAAAACGSGLLLAGTVYTLRLPGEIHFVDDFSEGSVRWVESQGDWARQGGVYVQQDLDGDPALTMLDLPTRYCYTYSFRARVLGGGDGLRIPFRFNGKWVWWKLGGPDRWLSYLEGIAPTWTHVTTDMLEPGRWYTIEIRVGGSGASGRLDGEVIWRTRHTADEVFGLQETLGELEGLVGLGTAMTQAEFDDVSISTSCLLP